jgi:cellulose synthase/poly-beta-1,6-N-acetylglucosamine synthase-like glycosyltransferase
MELFKVKGLTGDGDGMPFPFPRVEPPRPALPPGGALTPPDAIITQALLSGLAAQAALDRAASMAGGFNPAALDALMCLPDVDADEIAARLVRRLGVQPLDSSQVKVDTHRARHVREAVSSGLLRLPSGTLVVSMRGATLVRLARALLQTPALQARVRLASPGVFVDAAVRSAASSLARSARRGPAVIDRRLSAASSRLALAAFLMLAASALIALWSTIYQSLLAVIPFALMFVGLTFLRLLAVRPDPPEAPHPRTEDADLPLYTVLIPLYRESRCLPGLIAALGELDYPRHKLDLKLLVETGDAETRAALRHIHLPNHFEVVVLPDGQPRTKPRALNIGLALARGAFVAVFDAEDRPDREQLRDALHAFAVGGAQIGCVQARLAIDNINDGWLTRMFALEYAGLFDALLPGLARTGLLLPLGGTSNHFRITALDQLRGWDAWNVTEDADLGVRLARAGFLTRMIASSTYEEAPNQVHAWLKQRTRWLKGYVMTWIVHTRRPRLLLRELGWKNFLVFHAFIGCVPLSALMLPIFLTGVFVHTASGLWLTLESGWQAAATEFLDVVNLILGFGTAIALGAIGADRRGLGHLVRWLPSVPVYWLLSSVAMWRATFQLLMAPYLWEKTEHGLAKTSRSGLLKHGPKFVGDLLGRPRHVQRPDKAAARIHQVDHGGVVHRVGATLKRHLLGVGTVRLDHAVHRGLIARQAADAGIEAGEVALQSLRRVPLGIHRHEQRRDLRGIRPQPVEHLRQLEQCRRADIGAVGEAEEDDERLSLEIGVGDDRAVLVDHAEGPANQGCGRDLSLRTHHPHGGAGHHGQPHREDDETEKWPT